MLNRIGAVAGVVLRESYRRKDVYVLLFLTALITLAAGSANFFNDNQIVRYVREICLTLIWVSALVIAITMAARHIPMEQESRTIFPLLAKPITRREVLLGKFLGCWCACGLSLVMFYSFFAVVTLARAQGDWQIMQYVQAMLLHWSMLGIVVAMTLLGSLIFAAPSSATTILLVICGGILLLGRHLHRVAIQQAEPVQSLLCALYYAIPHLEFYDVRDLIVHDWPLVPWAVFALAVGYAAVYTAFFLAVAAWRFQRKSLT